MGNNLYEFSLFLGLLSMTFKPFAGHWEAGVSAVIFLGSALQLDETPLLRVDSRLTHPREFAPISGRLFKGLLMTDQALSKNFFSSLAIRSR